MIGELTNFFRNLHYLTTTLCSPSPFKVALGLTTSFINAALLALRPLLLYLIIVPSGVSAPLLDTAIAYVGSPALLLFNEITIIVLRFLIEILIGKALLENADRLREETIKSDLEIEIDSSSGELYSLVTQQIDLMKQAILHGMIPLISGISIIFALFAVNASNTFVFESLLAFCILSIAANCMMTAFRMKRIALWLKAEELKSEFIQSAFLNRSWLKLNNFRGQVISVAKDRFNNASIKFFNARLVEISGISMNEFSIAAIVIISVLILGNGTSTKVEIVLLLGVLLTASGAITNIGNSLNGIGDGMLAAWHLREFRERKNLPMDGDPVAIFSVDSDGINVVTVSWRCGNKGFEFKPFQLTKGNILWVKGPSGVGKSVLLRVLATKLRKQNIACDYYNHSVMFVEDRFLPRENNLLVSRYINAASISTLVGSKIVAPSGAPHSLGEAQRMHLLKIFASSADVIILDETMNGLPLEMQMKLLDYFAKTANASLIVCSHLDLSTVANQIIEPLPI